MISFVLKSVAPNHIPPTNRWTELLQTIKGQWQHVLYLKRLKRQVRHCLYLVQTPLFMLHLSRVTDWIIISITTEIKYLIHFVNAEKKEHYFVRIVIFNLNTQKVARTEFYFR